MAFSLNYSNTVCVSSTTGQVWEEVDTEIIFISSILFIINRKLELSGIEIWSFKLIRSLNAQSYEDFSVHFILQYTIGLS